VTASTVASFNVVSHRLSIRPGSMPVNSTCRRGMRDTDRSPSTGSLASGSGIAAVSFSFSVSTLNQRGERAQVAM
jgi:hypothetical protein